MGVTPGQTRAAPDAGRPLAGGLPDGIVVLERGWLSSNNIVLLGRDEAAVIDTGYWSHSALTIDLVERAVGGRAVTSVANTHLHSDHCGGNAALQERFPGARTLIPPGLADAVRDWDPVALTYEPTGQVCPRFRFDGVLEPRSVVRLAGQAWEVHAAPGHDPHSVILFERASRTLISADALWQNGFGVVFPELEGQRAFDEVGDTLDLIEQLAPDRIIPGHGSPFTDVQDALGRARSRLAAYRADPRRHASHAAKVLMKFRLLEWQEVPCVRFLGWAESTPYLRTVHERFFPSLEMRTWITGLVGELVRGGAAQIVEGMLANA